MQATSIKGGAVLEGKVSASGSKNAALPLLFSSLLAEGRHVFHNVPLLKDIDSTQLLLRELNASSQRDGHSLTVDVAPPEELFAPYDIVRKMRASILCLGPLLSKYGQARVSLPGGCAIGSRPINLHLEPLKQMGATIDIEDGYVIANAKRLHGERILFDNVTVGGTENVMMAAALAKGTTVLENAAKEPEVVDLARYIRKMGATIEGEGTSVIHIEGVDELQASEHEVIPDRIEAGTLLIAGAITGGDVTVEKCRPDDLFALLEKMRESGFEFDTGDDWIRVKPMKDWSSVDISTAPHPSFPTDLQAQFMALMTQATGTSVITEGVFENRFMHVQELARLGADVMPKTHVAVVRGIPGGLKGARVMATDLRASASLILGGLVAKGETVVGRIYHLDRGYENLEGKLKSLGANIARIDI